MKKNKKCNYPYILAILAILAILFILFMPIKMKETYISTKIPSDFIPNSIQIGPSSSPINNLNMAVMYQPNIDYTDEDISHNTFNPGTPGMYTTCFNSCLNNSSCTGIVTDFEQGNIEDDKRQLPYNCWMKSSMNKKTISTMSNPRYSTIFPRNYIEMDNKVSVAAKRI